MQTIINLVAAGMGVAWVPAEMRHLRRDGVVYREGLHSAPRCASSLLCAPGTSEVAQRFVTQVRAAVSARRW
jgi:DNA-binding transcriptional LysR family regulator